MKASRRLFRRILGRIRLATALVPALLVLALAPIPAAAASKAYRCELGGKVSYSDAPCPTGKQAELDVDARSPSPAERAAALNRARNDKAQIEQIDRVRDNEIKQRAGRQGKLQKQDEARHKQCAKLEVKVKHAREDLAGASVRESKKTRTKLRRAEEEYAAAACR